MTDAVRLSKLWDVSVEQAERIIVEATLTRDADLERRTMLTLLKGASLLPNDGIIVPEIREFLTKIGEAE